MERRQVFFSGNVQGVGFRFNSQQVARDFDVAGYVRNLPDGRVEVVAEGEPAELEAYLTRLSEAMSGYIRETEVHVSDDVDRQWTGFQVRY